MNNIEKALAFFQGISSNDSALAVKYIDPERYVEHNPRAGDGIEGLKRYVDYVAASHPDLKVIRAFHDGDFVVTQADGHVHGDGTFFDVFRFENGLIVEHWAFSAKAGPPNKSGHTQVDGPTEANPHEDTEKNKSLVREYYQAFHIEGRHEVITQYFSGDRCVRHEPGVADGIGEFLNDLKIVARDRTIDQIKLLLGQGDFVFLAAQGTHHGEPCLYIDLYSAESGKIVEHWGFPSRFRRRKSGRTAMEYCDPIDAYADPDEHWPGRKGCFRYGRFRPNILLGHAGSPEEVAGRRFPGLQRGVLRHRHQLSRGWRLGRHGLTQLTNEIGDSS